MNYPALPSPRGPEEKEDLGFGAVVSSASHRRLLNADGVMSLDISRLDETQPAA